MKVVWYVFCLCILHLPVMGLAIWGRRWGPPRGRQKRVLMGRCRSVWGSKLAAWPRSWLIQRNLPVMLRLCSGSVSISMHRHRGNSTKVQSKATSEIAHPSILWVGSSAILRMAPKIAMGLLCWAASRICHNAYGESEKSYFFMWKKYHGSYRMDWATWEQNNILPWEGSIRCSGGGSQQSPRMDHVEVSHTGSPGAPQRPMKLRL